VSACAGDILRLVSAASLNRAAAGTVRQHASLKFLAKYASWLQFFAKLEPSIPG